MSGSGVGKLVLAALLAWGCGDGAGQGADLAGADGGGDPGGDLGGDLAPDVTPDAASDTASDAGSDPGADGGSDPGSDPGGPSAVALLCATGPVPQTQPAQALRLEVTPAGGGFDVRIRQAALHARISGPLPEPVEETVAATGSVGGAWALQWGGGSLDANADAPAGPVRSGTLTHGGVAGLAVYCWAPGPVLPHRYDPATGTCGDADGAAERVRLPVAFVRETGLAECADLAGVALEEEDYYYPRLEGWDLRGASLRGAALHFAGLYDARLEGADLTDLDFGYAEIAGTVDAYTVLAGDGPEASCVVDATDLFCRR